MNDKEAAEKILESEQVGWLELWVLTGDGDVQFVFHKDYGEKPKPAKEENRIVPLYRYDDDEVTP